MRCFVDIVLPASRVCGYMLGVVVLRALPFSQLLQILDLLPTNIAMQRSIILVVASAFEFLFGHAGFPIHGPIIITSSRRFFHARLLRRRLVVGIRGQVDGRLLPRLRLRHFDGRL